MGSSGSTKTVIAAILGNAVLSGLKLLAFTVSGSGAMLSEGIHSIADTVNQFLLWIGIKLSDRPPDKKHPYGYGAERYLWALISAMGIFVFGAGVTIYHGIHQLLHPTLAKVGFLTWIVLALAALIDGAVMMMALKEANRQRGKQPWIKFLKTSRDPTLIAVLLEDAIAVLGVLVAATGIALSHLYQTALFDAAASILIGILLGTMAMALALRNRTLLLGQAANPEIERRIRKAVLTDPVVGKILALRTRVLAADAHMVDLQVDFDVRNIVDRLGPFIEQSKKQVAETGDLETFAQSFAQEVVDQLAQDVDQLEEKIKEAVPTARIIDIEGD